MLCTTESGVKDAAKIGSGAPGRPQQSFSSFIHETLGDFSIIVCGHPDSDIECKLRVMRLKTLRWATLHWCLIFLALGSAAFCRWIANGQTFFLVLVFWTLPYGVIYASTVRQWASLIHPLCVLSCLTRPLLYMLMRAGIISSDIIRDYQYKSMLPWFTLVEKAGSNFLPLGFEASFYVHVVRIIPEALFLRDADIVTHPLLVSLTLNGLSLLASFAWELKLRSTLKEKCTCPQSEKATPTPSPTYSHHLPSIGQDINSKSFHSEHCTDDFMSQIGGSMRGAFGSSADDCFSLSSKGGFCPTNVEHIFSGEDSARNSSETLLDCPLLNQISSSVRGARSSTTSAQPPNVPNVCNPLTDIMADMADTVDLINRSMMSAGSVKVHIVLPWSDPSMMPKGTLANMNSAIKGWNPNLNIESSIIRRGSMIFSLEISDNGVGQSAADCFSGLPAEEWFTMMNLPTPKHGDPLLIQIGYQQKVLTWNANTGKWEEDQNETNTLVAGAPFSMDITSVALVNGVGSVLLDASLSMAQSQIVAPEQPAQNSNAVVHFRAHCLGCEVPLTWRKTGSSTPDLEVPLTWREAGSSTTDKQGWHFTLDVDASTVKPTQLPAPVTLEAWEGHCVLQSCAVLVMPGNMSGVYKELSEASVAAPIDALAKRESIELMSSSESNEMLARWFAYERACWKAPVQAAQFKNMSAMGAKLMLNAVSCGQCLTVAAIYQVLQKTFGVSFHGVSEVAKAEFKQTLLHLAVMSGSLDMVKLVMEINEQGGGGLTWRTPNEAGCSPLHVLAFLDPAGALLTTLLAEDPAAREAWENAIGGMNSTPEAIARHVIESNCVDQDASSALKTWDSCDSNFRNSAIAPSPLETPTPASPGEVNTPSSSQGGASSAPEPPTMAPSMHLTALLPVLLTGFKDTSTEARFVLFKNSGCKTSLKWNCYLRLMANSLLICRALRSLCILSIAVMSFNTLPILVTRNALEAGRISNVEQLMAIWMGLRAVVQVVLAHEGNGGMGFTVAIVIDHMASALAEPLLVRTSLILKCINCATTIKLFSLLGLPYATALSTLLFSITLIVRIKGEMKERSKFLNQEKA
eukprot:gene25122-10766_t